MRTSSSATQVDTRRIVTGNANSVQVLVEFASSDENISPVFNAEAMSIVVGKHVINNAELSNTIISIADRGIGYELSATNVVYGSQSDTLNTAAELFRTTYLGGNMNIGLYALTISGGDGTGADGFAVANVGGNEVVNYVVINEGGSDRFSDKSWVLLNKVAENVSRNTHEVVSLEFRPNLEENRLEYTENGVQYPIGGKYKHFAVKLALLSDDSTVIPVVKNLRIIAVPAG